MVRVLRTNFPELGWEDWSRVSVLLAYRSWSEQVQRNPLVCRMWIKSAMEPPLQDSLCMKSPKKSLQSAPLFASRYSSNISHSLHSIDNICLWVLSSMFSMIHYSVVFWSGHLSLLVRKTELMKSSCQYYLNLLTWRGHPDWPPLWCWHSGPSADSNCPAPHFRTCCKTGKRKTTTNPTWKSRGKSRSTLKRIENKEPPVPVEGLLNGAVEQHGHIAARHFRKLTNKCQREKHNKDSQKKNNTRLDLKIFSEKNKKAVLAMFWHFQHFALQILSRKENSWKRYDLVAWD